uniref:7TM_GPCR_Srx domain-containing protein n=1 Tax=Bursaphelenchus xylophilus TaxID=6326 RepID=A0A1I7RJD8_BURXY
MERESKRIPKKIEKVADIGCVPKVQNAACLEVAIGLGRPNHRARPGLSRFEKAMGRPDRFGPRAGPTLSARPGPEGLSLSAIDVLLLYFHIKKGIDASKYRPVDFRLTFFHICNFGATCLFFSIFELGHFFFDRKGYSESKTLILLTFIAAQPIFLVVLNREIRRSMMFVLGIVKNPATGPANAHRVHFQNSIDSIERFPQ